MQSGGQVRVQDGKKNEANETQRRQSVWWLTVPNPQMREGRRRISHPNLSQLAWAAKGDAGHHGIRVTPPQKKKKETKCHRSQQALVS